jgi:hypothetical protein
MEESRGLQRKTSVFLENIYSCQSTGKTGVIKALAEEIADGVRNTSL